MIVVSLGRDPPITDAVTFISVWESPSLTLFVSTDKSIEVGSPSLSMIVTEVPLTVTPLWVVAPFTDSVSPAPSLIESSIGVR